MSGNIYLFGTTILTLLYFLSAIPMLKEISSKNASLILKASVLYLPLLMVIIIIDKGI
jgi:heme O synthase-like polyprenyltransferase